MLAVSLIAKNITFLYLLLSQNMKCLKRENFFISLYKLQNTELAKFICIVKRFSAISWDLVSIVRDDATPGNNSAASVTIRLHPK